MAEPAAENEDYMTMDADLWSEDDNTYEVADTLGIDYNATRDSREQQPNPVFNGKNREELKKSESCDKRNTAKHRKPKRSHQPPPLS